MQRAWPADTVERRPVASLLPHARNARTHSEAQVAQIAAAIREWGWTVPVLVDEAGQLIAGHGRVLAAKSLGLLDVPAMVARGWSEADKRAYALADNKLTLNAGWDADLLKGELFELRSDGFDLGLTGFGADEVAGLLGDLAEVAAADTGESGDASGGGAGIGMGAASEGDEDPADAEPVPPRQAVARPGDLWRLGEHRLLCGDSTDAACVARVLGGERAALLFTSPPYGNQRAYTTGGISDWDALMQGVFRHAREILQPDGQVLVNLGMIHREGEWQPYWDGWIAWMRDQGWRRFGWYVWDQGPALPGDWNGRLGPAFEFVFHFNTTTRHPNKWIPCTWAGHIAPSKGGLRAQDGKVGEWQHAGKGVQETRIPDGVLRITRHKARGIETQHPAVFPVLLPEFVMHSYSSAGDLCFEPFGGSGTTMLAGQRSGRRVASIELAPVYVDLAIARWREQFPSLPITLEADGRSFDAVAAERAQKEAAE